MESNKPRLIDIIKISDPRGNLAILQANASLPFEPARAYWINDVPAGEMRTGHAYHSSRELIIALAGSMQVVTQSLDGEISRFTLHRPDQGLFIPSMTWRELTDFTTNSVVLIVSDSLYNPVDYIRDKNEFDNLTGLNDNKYE